MLRSVKYQDRERRFAEPPQLSEAVVNTEEVVMIVETESDVAGPWSRLRLRGGEEMIIQGRPEDFLGDLA
jgi:hypothetical protein